MSPQGGRSRAAGARGTAVRHRWRAARTPVAAAVNALGLVVTLVVLDRMTFFDLHLHRHPVFKALPWLWLLGWTALTVAAVSCLRRSRIARDRGGAGKALGLAGTARTLFHVSAAMALAPTVFLGAVALLGPMLIPVALN